MKIDNPLNIIRTAIVEFHDEWYQVRRKPHEALQISLELGSIPETEPSAMR